VPWAALTLTVTSVPVVSFLSPLILFLSLIFILPLLYSDWTPWWVDVPATPTAFPSSLERVPNFFKIVGLFSRSFFQEQVFLWYSCAFVFCLLVSFVYLWKSYFIFFPKHHPSSWPWKIPWGLCRYRVLLIDLLQAFWFSTFVVPPLFRVSAFSMQ